MNARRPPLLAAGDRVHLLSISRRIDFDLTHTRQQLENWGLAVSEGPSVTAQSGQFAGDVELRRQDFQQALDDPHIKAIIFCRGGYGAAQIIDTIDFSRHRRAPKWLVGSSDLTLVHAHMSNMNLATLHAAMPLQYAQASREDFDSLHNCLFGPTPRLSLSGLDIIKPADVDGEICGGNLSMIQTLAGTPSDLGYDGKILLIEDVYENLMSIERMLLTLKRAGKLARLAALLVGDFSIPIKDNETSNAMLPHHPVTDQASAQSALKAVIKGLLADYTYPVCFDVPIGHMPGRNRAVYLNCPASLRMTPQTLEISYAAMA